VIRRQYYLERMRAVRREFRAAASAHELLAERLAADPSWGRDDEWTQRDAVRSRRNAEFTYIIRLYAMFEAGVRSVWNHHFERGTPANGRAIGGPGRPAPDHGRRV
jgi:hypothetical protein